jgi:hypothetical protein
MVGAVLQPFVQPFPANGAPYQVSSLGALPAWSRDGKELFYNTPSELNAVSVNTQPSFIFSNPTVLPRDLGNIPQNVFLPRNYDIMPDGRFLSVVAAGGQQGQDTSQIQVVINWFQELQQRVPR